MSPSFRPSSPRCSHTLFRVLFLHTDSNYLYAEQLKQNMQQNIEAATARGTPPGDMASLKYAYDALMYDLAPDSLNVVLTVS